MYENEIWKDVVGYEGLYQVSDWGRVRSLDRAIIQKGAGRNAGKPMRVAGRILKPTVPHKGYVAVYLTGKKKERLEIHRLVARAFLGPLPAKHHTHHKNGDSMDNRLKNLVYIAAPLHGHITHRGENAHTSVLSESDVIEIRRLLAQGKTQVELAKRYGVARSNIGAIERRETWTYL